tara:strand:- start:699 stop:1181 length:483 start_codon:yes stop_codon:yes gene_type:complete
MHVAVAGIMRRVSALNKSRGAQHGITPDREWQADIEGLAGEYVLAKHLGKFWQPVVGRLDTDEGDVHGLQVRTTAWKNGCLIVNKKDPDDDPFVLVTGDNSVGFNWYIRGWMYGRDAKKDEWWKAKQKDRYAYFVEQKHLRPMHELIDLSDKGGHNVHTP